MKRPRKRVRASIYTIKTHFKCICVYIYTSAHTLASSLHNMSCANNNREAVVVCFRLAFHASRMQFFWKFSGLKSF